jgi:hypothetical protein
VGAARTEAVRLGLAAVVLAACSAPPAATLGVSTPPPPVCDWASPPPPAGVDEYSIVAPADSWRFGVGVSEYANVDFWLPRLGAGWYLDWDAVARPGCARPEHWQMVRVHPEGLTPALEQIEALAAQATGLVWIVGNEPDVAAQDGVTPERYAAAYHDVYTALKAVDPGAQVAVAGVNQPTPLRLRYLDEVLVDYYAQFGERMPVDVWTVHGYLLNEARGDWGAGIPPGLPDESGEARTVADHGDLALFADQLRAFRGWLAERGYRDRPLALTEFGILMPAEYGYPPEVVSAFMRGAFDFLLSARDAATGDPADDNRLVQRWAWFSLKDSSFAASNLLAGDGQQLTPVGRAYRDYLLAFTP